MGKSKPKAPQVSIRGATFAKVKAHCEEKGLSVGAFVDGLCTAFLEGETPASPAPDPQPRRNKKKNGQGPLFTEEEKQKWREE